MSSNKKNKPETDQAEDKIQDNPTTEDSTQHIEEAETSATEIDDAEQNGDEATEVADLLKKCQDVQAQLDEKSKDYLYLMADFDNYRKRTIKEKGEIIKNAAERILKELLPIVDDFERGLDATKEATDGQEVRQGMELIYHKLVKLMESNGVKPIESTGKDFDSDLHDAIAKIPAPDEDSRGKVIDTTTKGYTLNDKVLRHAKVVVADK